MLLKSGFRKTGDPLAKFKMLPWFWFLGSSSVLIFTLWWSYRQFQVERSQPQAIFVLGGHESREKMAADLALQNPHLPVWVSSGSPEPYAQRIFNRAGVEPERLHLNYQAKDTVTNFTSLVEDLKSQNIDSVYLITSQTHMTRARLVGEIVFGSHGILIKPVSVQDTMTSDSPNKSVRDVARALLWLGTGSTGETWVRRTARHWNLSRNRP